MSWKKAGIIAGVTTGVFLGMKYVFPVKRPSVFFRMDFGRGSSCTGKENM